MNWGCNAHCKLTKEKKSFKLRLESVIYTFLYLNCKRISLRDSEPHFLFTIWKRIRKDSMFRNF